MPLAFSPLMFAEWRDLLLDDEHRRGARGPAMQNPLTSLISAEIRSSGPVPFRRFMELALYHPEHGYYSGGRNRPGRSGDFFTNVSVGSLFGRLMARQFSEMRRILGEPDNFSIVEQGAHGGEFAADVISALRQGDASYRIIEPSPALAELQREKLAGADVQWCASPGEVAPFTGVHFSNELPDAFPVHLVKWTGDRWLERCVDVTDGGFVFADAPISSQELAAAAAAIPQPLPAGYITEINLAARAWIAEVARRLVRGFVLAVDYGYERAEYYAPERIAGTLSAYSRHRRAADPLDRPGEVDLTAHVDFTSLIESAEGAGLRLVGFTDQHHFMVGLGEEHFADGANAADRRAFQTLMHPQFMGTAFKVVCFAKEIGTPPLAGFRYARPAQKTP